MPYMHRGSVWHAQGAAWPAAARHGAARPGKAWASAEAPARSWSFLCCRCGTGCRECLQRGLVGPAGRAWQGTARRGGAGPGWARQGVGVSGSLTHWARLPVLPGWFEGAAGLASARQGAARRGAAGSGMGCEFSGVGALWRYPRCICTTRRRGHGGAQLGTAGFGMARLGWARVANATGYGPRCP